VLFTGRIQKFFEEGVLNFFLYGRENLWGFWDFFEKKVKSPPFITEV